MCATTAPRRDTETQIKNSTHHTKTQENTTNRTETLVSLPSLPTTPSDKHPANMHFIAPQPVIKKSLAGSQKRQSTSLKQLSAKQHATELESRLDSSLTVAAGGITTLMENLVAKQNSKSIKDEQLSHYIARLGVISEELKDQLKTLGTSSKLANQQDHKSFDLSYGSVLALWNEYRRVSACVVQRARIWKKASARNTSENNDSSHSTSMSNSSTGSSGSTDREAGKQ